MALNEELPAEIKNKAKNIVEVLKGALSNPTENIHEIVEELEDKKFLEKNFQISKLNTNEYPKIAGKYRAFCNTYLMMLFFSFIEENDAEIMLIAYGFIKEYSCISTKKKLHKKYWKHAHEYNDRMNKKRKNKSYIFNEARRQITDELSVTLAKIVLDSSGKLNFAEKVFVEFCKNSIPPKLTLPITEYIKKYTNLDSKDEIYKPVETPTQETTTDKQNIYDSEQLKDRNDIGKRGKAISYMVKFFSPFQSKQNKLRIMQVVAVIILLILLLIRLKSISITLYSSEENVDIHLKAEFVSDINKNAKDVGLSKEINGDKSEIEESESD